MVTTVQTPSTSQTELEYRGLLTTRIPFYTSQPIHTAESVASTWTTQRPPAVQVLIVLDYKSYLKQLNPYQYLKNIFVPLTYSVHPYSAMFRHIRINYKPLGTNVIETCINTFPLPPATKSQETSMYPLVATIAGNGAEQ